MATDHEQSNDEPEKRVAVYSRVSAICADAQEQVALQKREIERFAEKAGVWVVKCYVEAGSNGRDL